MSAVLRSRTLARGIKPLGPPPLRVIPRIIALGFLSLRPFNTLYAMRSARVLKNARRIIALCKGNTCRSPFLAGYLIRRAAELGVSLPPVVSRGLLPQNGDPSSPAAVETARRFGVDLSTHASCSIQQETIGPSDVILVVMPLHLADLARLFPGSKPKFIYIGLLDPADHAPFVLDPYNGDAGTYHHTYQRLQRAVDRLLSESYR